MATENVMQPASHPQIELYQMAIGHYLSHAICLAAKLNIADLLKDGPRHFGDLAQATGTDAAALNRALRLLASAGVFEEMENGKFTLTSLGDCLREGVPGSVRALVMLFAGNLLQNGWKGLEYSVRTGEPSFRNRGFDDFFTELAQYPEEAANFDAAMADLTRLIAVGVIAAYDFSSLQTLVDVGGGNGTLLIEILKANPHLHGTVFDQSDVAERAKKQIAESGLVERCKTIGGDFFKEVPSGADAYILKHIIHDWSDDLALTILQNCRIAMGSATGKLLIVEGIYPSHIDQSADSRGAAANDVNMLVNTGGRQRSKAEFQSLFERAGFELTRIVPTPPGTAFAVSVLEGTPRAARR
jgi:orsellinic acid C2-O-methyltransferase